MAAKSPCWAAALPPPRDKGRPLGGEQAEAWWPAGGRAAWGEGRQGSSARRAAAGGCRAPCCRGGGGCRAPCCYGGGCRGAVLPRGDAEVAEQCIRASPSPAGMCLPLLWVPIWGWEQHWGHCWPVTKPRAVGLQAAGGRLGSLVAGTELRVRIPLSCGVRLRGQLLSPLQTRGSPAMGHGERGGHVLPSFEGARCRHAGRGHPRTLASLSGGCRKPAGRPCGVRTSEVPSVTGNVLGPVHAPNSRHPQERGQHGSPGPCAPPSPQPPATVNPLGGHVEETSGETES